MKSEKEYSIKRLTKERISDLLPLYQKAFNVDVDLVELNNKYLTGELIEDYLGFLAYLDEECVAFVGAIPHFIQYDNEVIEAVQIGDVMTDPKHLKAGLFVKLAKVNFEYCESLGVKIIYGFPNLKSKPGFKKRLGWQFNDELNCRIVNVKCIPLHFLALRFSFLSRVINKYQNFVLTKFWGTEMREFKSIASAGNTYGVIKSKEYLAYKEKHKKQLFISVLNKVVWVKLSGIYMLVGDVEDCTKTEFNQILYQLKRMCFILGVPHLRFNVSGNSKLIDFLNKFSKEDSRKYSIGYLVFDDNIDMRKVAFTMADNDTF